MRPLGLSIDELARDLYMPVARLSEVINEERGITAETALRLARYFGTTPEVWLNLQSNYELIEPRPKRRRDRTHRSITLDIDGRLAVARLSLRSRSRAS